MICPYSASNSLCIPVGIIPICSCVSRSSVSAVNSFLDVALSRIIFRRCARTRSRSVQAVRRIQWEGLAWMSGICVSIPTRSCILCGGWVWSFVGTPLFAVIYDRGPFDLYSYQPPICGHAADRRSLCSRPICSVLIQTFYRQVTSFSRKKVLILQICHTQ